MGCFVAAGLCPAAAFCAGLGTTLDRARFPAELLIVQGDLQRLTFSDRLSSDERLGLEGRIGSALEGIEWLALEHEALTRSIVSRDALQRLQESWLTRDLASALERVSGLARNHSLNVGIFSPDRATLDDVGRVQEIDAQLCQGCHIDSVGAAKRDLQGSRCPMCCAHCNGVFEMPGDQGLHAAGCAKKMAQGASDAELRKLGFE